MNFDLPVDLMALQREATEMAVAHADEGHCFEDAWLMSSSVSFSRAMADRGWLGMAWPTEFGGSGRDPLERFVIMEALLSHGAPMALSWAADRQVGPALIDFGSPAQQQRHLPAIVRGEEMWAIGLSEPDAGSDITAIRTSAIRHGDEYVLNGTKIWTSGARLAKFIYLVARTDPTSTGHDGLSDLIVPTDLPGVTIAPIRDMAGNRHFCEVHLNEVRIPASALIGTENGSFKQVMKQLERERGGIDRLLTNRALYLASRKRGQLNSPLIRQSVARMESRYDIGRLMILREILGQTPPGWSAMTKTFCTEFEVEVANWCSAVAGAETMVWGREARAVCMAPGYTLQGGSTQILRNITAERMLGLPR